MDRKSGPAPFPAGGVPIPGTPGASSASGAPGIPGIPDTPGTPGHTNKKHQGASPAGQYAKPEPPPGRETPLSPILQLEEFSVGYGRRCIADPVTLGVNAGTITAILGPNGSGKTTLLSTLAGLIPPLSGRVSVRGQNADLKTQAWKRCIARVADGNDLFPGLSAIDHVELARRVAGLDTKEAELRRTRVFDMIGMDETTAKILAGDLSLGYRKRLALALSLFLPADLWLLDEPTTGLDSDSIGRLEALLQMLKDAGKIILVSTHAADWVEKFADYKLIMHGVFSKGHPAPQPEASTAIRMPASQEASARRSEPPDFHTPPFRPGVPPWLESSTW